jgi:hypothetical protein
MSLDLRVKPKTSDGRPISLTSRFRGDVDPYFAGVADTDAGRALGDLFCINWGTAPGSPDDKLLEFAFCDWVYVAKGTVRWVNAGPGDYLAFKAFAPATTTVANEGSGNCNLVPTGLGFSAIVPSVAGSHDYSDPIPIRWVGKLPIIGSGFEELHPETKARKILPHWKMRVDIHNESLGELCVTWHLDCARKKTT